MATKKTKSNFVEVKTRQRDRYRLTDTMMVALGRGNRVHPWGHFMPRGEMRRVLEQVYRTGLQGEAIAFLNTEGERLVYRARNAHGELMIGCNTFSKTAVHKLARWAGVDIASR